MAAPFAARQYVRNTGFVALEAAGHECTSTWAEASREIRPETLGPSPETEHEDVVRHVLGDLADIDRSNAVIQLTAQFCMGEAGCTTDQNLHSGGRNVELGYALARDLTVVVVGADENVFQRGLCMTAATLAEAIELLDSLGL